MALLALLALTLLAPVHLIHAIERDTLATVVETDCEEHDGHAQHGKHQPVYCPVCALAKAAANLVVPTTPLPIRLAVVAPVHFAIDDAEAAIRPQDVLPQARAPPVSV
jgi:hypothetical protein